MNIEEKKIFLIEDGVALTRNFFIGIIQGLIMKKDIQEEEYQCDLSSTKQYLTLGLVKERHLQNRLL